MINAIHWHALRSMATTNKPVALLVQCQKYLTDANPLPPVRGQCAYQLYQPNQQEKNHE